MSMGFTKEQQEYIRKEYPAKTIHTLKNELKCTWNKVNNFLVKEGLKQEPQDISWSMEKVEQLKKLATKCKVPEIAKILNRTENSIWLFCNRQGIELLKHKRDWKAVDDEILRELWGNFKIETISKRMNRSIKSLKVRAQRIGLPPMIVNTGIMTVAEFCRYSGVSADRIKTLQKLGLKIKSIAVTCKKRYKIIDLEVALEFIRQNPELFDASKIEEGLFIPEPDWLKEKRKADKKSKKHLHYQITKHPWTTKEQKLVVKYKAEGFEIREIANKLNRPINSIIDILKKKKSIV